MKTIGIMGSSQIYHIIPLLEEEYNVVDLQKIIVSNKNKLLRIIRLIKKILEIDILYNVFTDRLFIRKAFICKCLRKKVVTHWIGSDVLFFKNGSVNKRVIKHIDSHLTCFEGLKNELQESNVESTVIPIIPYNYSFNISKMPERHSVLLYIPQGREEFYGYEKLYAVAKAFNNVIFYVVGNDNRDLFKDCTNVKLLGRISGDKMEELYDSVSIVIRIPRHDGLSMMVVEAMAKGKTVIWNQKFEGIIFADTFQELIDVIKEITNKKPEINVEGHKMVADKYKKENILNEYKHFFSSI